MKRLTEPLRFYTEPFLLRQNSTIFHNQVLDGRFSAERVNFIRANNDNALVWTGSFKQCDGRLPDEKELRMQFSAHKRVLTDCIRPD